MPEHAGAVPVSVAGLYRGRDLDGEGTVTVSATAVTIAVEQNRIVLRIDEIDGVRRSGASLELFLASGDVLQLSSPSAMTRIAEDIVRVAIALPELTRSLRALGTRRAKPDADHDRFFAPLLSARRRAQGCTTPEDCLRVCDATTMRAELDRHLRDFARARYPRSGADRRSLEADLEDCARGVFARLDELAIAGNAVRMADDTARFATWRQWTNALRAVFESADSCWLAIRPSLERPRMERRPLWRRLLRLGTLAGVCAIPGTIDAQHMQMRIRGVPADSLRSRDFDVVSSAAGFTIVVADSADRVRLAQLGWRAEQIVTQGGLARAAPGALRATTIYRSFDDPARGIRFFLDSIANANPGRAHLEAIGSSVEGRPLLVLKIGPADDSPSRPNVLFMATYHAREWAATEMALRLIKYLTGDRSERTDSLVAGRDIWILPVANPDGYEFTFTADRFWRKNRRPNADGTFGVDLNRNHSFKWGLDAQGSSPIPASEVYRGTAPESEPETRAIVAFHEAHPPVLSVSYHTFTGLILYPPGYQSGKLADDFGIFRALAGTDVQPAVRDRLPGSNRDHYRPAPGWNLYPTNGEYTDWAYFAHGSIAFTPELSSGFEFGQFYGFDFPGDEPRLATLFEDNLPFALDVLDAARDPLNARPGATGIASERIGIESVSPAVRVRVPLAEMTRTSVRSPASVPLVPDPSSDVSVYTRRLVSTPIARPGQLKIDVGSAGVRYDVLSATGAERNDTPWFSNGFLKSQLRIAGDSAWASGNGKLRSPAIAVPAGMDSISVLFWTRYLGDPFSLLPRGEIHYSVDAGQSWTLAGLVAGVAETYYPERADIAGVAGKTLLVEFTSLFGSAIPTWWLDEITVVARSSVVASGPGVIANAGFRPSENPVRGGTVRFLWPFAGTEGDVIVYDIGGRKVWHTTVSDGSQTVTWKIAESGAANGVYVVVLRSGGHTVRGKLFVTRGES
ncbi:MAG: M14 family zinc carboxypeptidase [Gemmatimonadaceae bacterium]